MLAKMCRVTNKTIWTNDGVFSFGEEFQLSKLIFGSKRDVHQKNLHSDLHSYHALNNVSHRLSIEEQIWNNSIKLM